MDAQEVDEVPSLLELAQQELFPEGLLRRLVVDAKGAHGELHGGDDALVRRRPAHGGARLDKSHGRAGRGAQGRGGLVASAAQGGEVVP